MKKFAVLCRQIGSAYDLCFTSNNEEALTHHFGDATEYPALSEIIEIDFPERNREEVLKVQLAGIAKAEKAELARHYQAQHNIEAARARLLSLPAPEVKKVFDDEGREVQAPFEVPF